MQSLELKPQPTPNIITHRLIMTKAKNICVECESPYFIDSSKMTDLCPNCAYKLYGYPNCTHQFKNEKCAKCGWNGQESNYIKRL